MIEAVEYDAISCIPGLPNDSQEIAQLFWFQGLSSPLIQSRIERKDTYPKRLWAGLRTQTCPANGQWSKICTSDSMKWSHMTDSVSKSWILFDIFPLIGKAPWHKLHANTLILGGIPSSRMSFHNPESFREVPTVQRFLLKFQIISRSYWNLPDCGVQCQANLSQARSYCT